MNFVDTISATCMEAEAMIAAIIVAAMLLSAVFPVGVGGGAWFYAKS